MSSLAPARQQAEVEAAGVDDQAFEDVVVAAQVGAAHGAGFVQVRVGSFELLAALTLQAFVARPTQSPAVGVHRFLGVGLALPSTPPALRFADLRTQSHRLHSRILSLLRYPLSATTSLIGDAAGFVVSSVCSPLASPVCSIARRRWTAACATV